MNLSCVAIVLIFKDSNAKESIFGKRITNSTSDYVNKLKTFNQSELWLSIIIKLKVFVVLQYKLSIHFFVFS